MRKTPEKRIGTGEKDAAEVQGQRFFKVRYRSQVLSRTDFPTID